ncbi:hypothetical protein ACFYY5_20780, partial [Nocardia elegans]
SPSRGEDERNQNKTFGTDIHRHTIEFSKNTRTSNLTGFFPVDRLGNFYSLAQPEVPDQIGVPLTEPV